MMKPKTNSASPPDVPPTSLIERFSMGRAYQTFAPNLQSKSLAEQKILKNSLEEKLNQRHLAAMRMAPSMRMVSPLIMLFSMMCPASAAYSAGWPRRFGNGTCSLKEAGAPSGSVPSLGL